MRLSLRFILPLTFAIALVTYLILPLVDSFTLRWFTRDLDIRSKLVGGTLGEALPDLISEPQSTKRVKKYFDTAIQDERLYAVGLCDLQGKLLVSTETFPPGITCGSLEVAKDGQGEVVRLGTGSLHVASFVLMRDDRALGRLILIHDMSFIDRRSADTRRYVFIFFVGLAFLISLITVIIAQLSVRGLLQNIRGILRGATTSKTLAAHVRSPDLLPLAKDLRALMRDLEQDRRTRDESQISWNAKTLKTILNSQLAGDEVLIVSNREPYIHVHKGDSIEIQTPASGLVTALEPVMRACSGTWIAHGGGSADRAVVDSKDHIRVPPDNPSYQIRRVWLTQEEERGYYYGFSNEGLWPLCHIAHTRPTFRTSDWEQYVKVNEKFAEAVVQEAKTDDPVVLVQDYHFALLPKMIREKLPKATIITFWHIPWPNPEAFGICPWRDEILEGLLGSSIVGFHTRFHCNNFVDTVDRFLETRIDRENSTISYGGKLSAIKSYPISIEWPPQWLKGLPSRAECSKSIREKLSLSSDIKIAVGIDRLDYTKGILERFRSVERLFELHPEYLNKFSLIQIAAPSRSIIEEYRKFSDEVKKLVDRINARFGTDTWSPIILKVEHHEPSEVFKYYRGSDICVVTSLHDGMNLVAKEFIAARDDEQGVLILSQFTGASRELPEALVVNPYNADQCAEAISIALRMPAVEQRERMKSMRSLVEEFNVYRWAGRMLMDAAKMRQYQRLMGKLNPSDIGPEVGR